MQMGTRWAVGDNLPDGLPEVVVYAVQAVESYGILRGVVLAAWRLLRCNPWSHGGHDPVEAQRLFRP